MIVQLSKNQSLWIKYANSICKDSELAKDLVQDMYIKLHDCKKEISNSYVYSVIKNIYIDQLSNKESLIEDAENPEIDKDLLSELGFESMAAKIVLDKQKTYKKIIIVESHKQGIRKFSIKSGISRCQIQKIINEFRQEVRKKHQDLEMLSKKSPMQLELLLAKDAMKERII